MKQNLLKILVCDDSIVVRKKLKDMLLNLGYPEVYVAVNGQEAVDSYKEYHPDIVFMDIVMPVKSGIEAVAEIKEYDKNAKIVMASSSGTKTHLTKAIEAGAFNFIQKPFEESEILNILNKFSEEV